ncbi:Annexin C1 [Cladobotryum mycophilum]|uniref:Annexin n=1 Tax=Cladobotryum mycophilum TaxID=491253 RepID=A0ABR0SFQ2_9HYPO
MSYQGYGQPYGRLRAISPSPGTISTTTAGTIPPQHGQYPPSARRLRPIPPQQGGGYYQQPPPPPPGQYPPQQPPYGQPPPGQYGAPAPHQPYGHHSPAPPPGQYGAPPPQASPYGGAPPYGAPQVPPTPPSLGYGPPQLIQWDGSADAQALRSAMKGFGTDEKTLIRVLGNKDPLQIEVLRTTFERNFKRKLVDDLKKETSGYFEMGLVQIARGPLQADVHNLYEAISGLGTKEVVLNDILLSRSNADIKAIKSAYYHTYRRSLEEDVKGDLSMKTERHFMMVLAATRAEDSAPVVPQQVEDDVMNIYKATEGKMGTDEILVCSILSSRNDNQIRAISHSYKRKFNRDLESVLKSEFSGHMEDALLFQLRNAEDKYMHAAKLLEDTMAGLGTKDYLLVARVVRFHWNRADLANIKGAYHHRYRKTLASRIRGETSGDYERLMVACVGE